MPVGFNADLRTLEPFLGTERTDERYEAVLTLIDLIEARCTTHTTISTHARASRGPAGKLFVLGNPGASATFDLTLGQIVRWDQGVSCSLSISGVPGTGALDRHQPPWYRCTVTTGGLFDMNEEETAQREPDGIVLWGLQKEIG
jgi:hypothetical protein